MSRHHIPTILARPAYTVAHSWIETRDDLEEVLADSSMRAHAFLVDADNEEHVLVNYPDLGWVAYGVGDDLGWNLTSLPFPVTLFQVFGGELHIPSPNPKDHSR